MRTYALTQPLPFDNCTPSSAYRKGRAALPGIARPPMLDLAAKHICTGEIRPVPLMHDAVGMRSASAIKGAVVYPSANPNAHPPELPRLKVLKRRIIDQEPDSRS